MTQRSSEEWVRELCGDRGQEPQQLAYQELANYLYVVAYNYLRLRQADLRALADFAADDVAALAQDFVRNTGEGLAQRLCSPGNVQRCGQIHLLVGPDRPQPGGDGTPQVVLDPAHTSAADYQL